MGKIAMGILKAMIASGFIILWTGLDSITTLIIG